MHNQYIDVLVKNEDMGQYSIVWHWNFGMVCNFSEVFRHAGGLE
jgi:hypothetical protein